MRPSVRHQLVILAIGGAVFLANLGATRLWDQDEAYFARTAVEMHQRHEWVVPYFNDEAFAHKPPLMYWMMRIGFLLFGVNEFAARFWSAAFGLATSLLVYRLGRRMFNAEVGLWAGLAMCTALMFDVVSRAATPDSFLIFFSTLALYLFVRCENWESNSDDGRARSERHQWPVAKWAAIYAAMGLAVLVKGPIGVLLPGATLGLYLLVRDPIEPASRGETWGDRTIHFLRRFTPDRVAGAVWAMRPLTALVTILVIAGPWFTLVGWRAGSGFLWEFFGVQNLGRFVGAMDNHGGGVWYYIPAILIGFFPWSIFAIPTGLELARRCRQGEAGQRGAKFLACWMGVFVGFFSLAGTKLPNYVLPVYPALALATGCFIDRWIPWPATRGRWWSRASLGSLVVVGCTIAIGTAVVGVATVHGQPLLERWGVASELAGDLPVIGSLGLILAVGGCVCLVLAEMAHRRAAMVGLMATATVFSTLGFAVVAVRIDRHQPSPALAQSIHRHAIGKAQVAQFGYFRPSLVYYADSRVESCKNPERVAEFLAQSLDSFVVTTEEQFTRLSPRLPADVVVVAREADFPRRGTVLVLGRNAEVAGREVGVKQ